MRHVILAIFVLALSACSLSRPADSLLEPVDSTAYSKTKEVQIYTKRVSSYLEYNVLSEVTGESDFYDGNNQGWQVALTRAKLKVLRLGGNALLVNKTTKPFKLSGYAIKITNNKITQCVESLAAIPGIALLKDKLPIKGGKASLEMLMNDSHPSKKERKIIKKWGGERLHCLDLGAKFSSEDFLDYRFIKILEEYAKDNIKPIISLAKGKYSFSQYNTAIDKINGKFQQDNNEITRLIENEKTAEKTAKAAQERNRYLEQQRQKKLEEKRWGDSIGNALQKMSKGGIYSSAPTSAPTSAPAYTNPVDQINCESNCRYNGYPSFYCTKFCSK